MFLFLLPLEKPEGKEEQRKAVSETCGCDLNVALRRAGKVSQVDTCRKEPGLGSVAEDDEGFEQLSESGRPLPLLPRVDGNCVRGAAPMRRCAGRCGGSRTLSLLPAPAAPRAGERAGGWRWYAAAYKMVCKGLDA